MTEKRFTVLKKLENCDVEGDVIDTYIERLVKEGKSVGWVTVGILDNGNPITYKDCVDLLNENEQLKKDREELFIRERDTKNEWRELKQENEQLKQLLDYAEDLIQSHLFKHFIRQWRNFKTGHKEYNDFWEEKLKTHKELKENVE